MSIKTAIWDLESDGLLPELTRIHCLVVRDFERKITYRFRRNEVEDTIDDGIDMLESAETIVGHNNIYFDEPALHKVYDGVNIQGRRRDTLVMARMVFSDQKEKDYRLVEKGKLPGKMIGSHSLKAWGLRMGFEKGDYADVMEDRAKEHGISDPAEIARFVWGKWSQEMEDYNVTDVDVTVLLWQRILRSQWDERATKLEHTIHDLMGTQRDNGIYFNVPEAEKLAVELETESHELEQKTIEHYGKWWVPAKKRIVRPLWDDPDGINKTKQYAKRLLEFGEDKDPKRAVWAEVTVPKKSMKFKDVLRGDRTEGAPFCAVEMKEFNPNSRQQVIDRFSTVYNWHPVDFTEAGNPEVSDDVLRKLTDQIPMALELAELFYYKKRLGQLKTGRGAWLKKVTPEGKIHGSVNVGGTVSGRGSHIDPNLGQVPKVKFGKRLVDGVMKTVLLKGREGDHGWNCRRLFYVPPPFEQTGIDLSGIELRCFGEKLARYDKGAYLDIVLSGDIHSSNQQLAELPSRDNAKTFIYALLYGAGDVKLGSIVAPLADEEDQREIGVKLRARFMKNLPAFAQLVKEVKRYAGGGFIPGLDGRRLFVRSPHSALNTWLQSDAALISKEWLCRTESYLLDEGLEHGWNGDFAMMLWIHDEMQIASRGHGALVERLAIKAAADAGLHFGYRCPIAAEAKHGMDWAACH